MHKGLSIIVAVGGGRVQEPTLKRDAFEGLGNKVATLIPDAKDVSGQNGRSLSCVQHPPWHSKQQMRNKL